MLLKRQKQVMLPSYVLYSIFFLCSHFLERNRGSKYILFVDCESDRKGNESSVICGERDAKHLYLCIYDLPMKVGFWITESLYVRI